MSRCRPLLKKKYLQISAPETLIGQSINKKSSKMMSEIMRNNIEISAQMMQDPATQDEINQQVAQTLGLLFKQAKRADKLITTYEYPKF
jgi:hypothetical protein